MLSAAITAIAQKILVQDNIEPQMITANEHYDKNTLKDEQTGDERVVNALDVDEDTDVNDNNEPEWLTLSVNNDGFMYRATQVDDYLYRNVALSSVCFYDFV